MLSFNPWSRRERKVERTTPVDKEKDVLYSERLYEEFRASQRDWALQAREDSEFRHNVVFTKQQRQAIEARGLAPVGIPLLHQAVEQAVSMLTARTPSFQATGREDSDVRVAKLFTDLLSYVWYISDGNQRLKQAIDDYYVKGRGVLFAFADPVADMGRGEVKITDLDPLEVYPDPHSRDRLWRDAGHIIVSRLITREQADATWPDLRDTIAKAQPSEDDESRGTGRQHVEDQQLAGDDVNMQATRYRLIERYSKVRVPEYRIFEGEEKTLSEEDYQNYRQERAYIFEVQGNLSFGLSESEIAYYDRQYEAFSDGQSPAIIPVPTQDGQIIMARLFLTTKGALVDEGVIRSRKIEVTRVEVLCSLGGVKLYRYILPTEHYPIVPLNNRHDRNPYPMSDARFVRPMIELYNKTQQIIIAHASSVAGGAYFYEEGTLDDGIEEKLARPGSKMIPVRGEKMPQPLQVHQLPGEFYVNQDRLKAQIHEALGLYPFQQGDPSNSPETFRGTLQMDEFNLRRIKSKLDDIYAGLNQLAKVVVDLIQDVYTHEKVVRLVEPNGEEVEAFINQGLYDAYGNITDLYNDITTVDADVVIVSGSTMPSNRYALLDYYLQFYQQGIIDQVEVLKKSEIFDREGVLKRSSLMAQQQQQIEQLQEEVKRLQGDLQTREREVYHSKQQEEIAKFKASLEGPKQSVRKDAELFTQRTNDQLKSNEALLKAIDEL